MKIVIPCVTGIEAIRENNSQNRGYSLEISFCIGDDELEGLLAEILEQFGDAAVQAMIDKLLS